MNTLAEKYQGIRIVELSKKNTALSAKCEMFRKRLICAKKNVETLKSKQQTKVKVVVELIVDGLLKLTDQQAADKLFVDIAYIKNTKSLVRRERK
ncbi:MAG TPA: hypothetical protein EYN67_16875 [Flavobacteriales bacterium]|nr:hypothetical protein [Methylococcaceae bacterium]HHZ97175.1 hypothetical protein [Flavobacteriales bacterium]